MIPVPTLAPGLSERSTKELLAEGNRGKNPFKILFTAIALAGLANGVGSVIQKTGNLPQRSSQIIVGSPFPGGISFNPRSSNAVDITNNQPVK